MKSKIKGLAAVLALSFLLTGCNWVAMPGGSFTTMDDKTVNWLEEEYGYTGSGILTKEMAHAWEIRRDLNAHLYEKYYLEDDYQFLNVVELFNREGCLIWEDDRYVFGWKDSEGYHEMVSEDGHLFITEDGEEFWTEISPDNERYENWKYRNGILDAPENIDPGFTVDPPEDIRPVIEPVYEHDMHNN